MIGRDLLLSSRYGLARRADPAAPTASDPSDARYAVEATLSIADRTWREAQQRLGIVGGLVIGMAHASPSAPSQNVTLGGSGGNGPAVAIKASMVATALATRPTTAR